MRLDSKEVCCVLGIRNHRMALSRLDDDEKRGVSLTDAIGRLQETIMVNEPGLYHLIYSSTKKSAQRFKRWNRRDVLPQIRKKCKLWAGIARNETETPCYGR